MQLFHKIGYHSPQIQLGFESAGGEKGDVFQYADLIVDHFQTEHPKIKVDSARVLPSLEQCIKARNEPMIRHDCIGYGDRQESDNTIPEQNHLPGIRIGNW